MAAPLGSLEGAYVPRRPRNIHEEQDDLIRREFNLVKKKNASTSARKVAPGTNNNSHPRIRRRFNRYGSKPKLTPAYINSGLGNGSLVPNPKLKMVRGRYETQRQCKYVPKMALMKMARDFGIEPFKNAREAEFKKGSKLWKALRTADICRAMSAKYRSRKRHPIKLMTAYRDQSLEEVKKVLEFMAVREKVKTVTNDGKQKSLVRLSKEIAKKLTQQ